MVEKEMNYLIWIPCIFHIFAKVKLWYPLWQTGMPLIKHQSLVFKWFKNNLWIGFSEERPRNSALTSREWQNLCITGHFSKSPVPVSCICYGKYLCATGLFNGQGQISCFMVNLIFTTHLQSVEATT